MSRYRTSRLNLTGRKFGQLTVIGFSHMTAKSRSVWRCRCKCGKEKSVLGTNLARGHSQSCGCASGRPPRAPRLDLAGKRFGRLQVLAFSHMAKGGRSMWLCQCDCGKRKAVPGSNLVRGVSRSCGCASAGRLWVHGFGREKLRAVWVSMKYACENPAGKAYRYYGGKGVKVCSEWQDYLRFRDWAMSSGFREDLLLGRVNCALDFAPGNCRWMTRSERGRLTVSEKSRSRNLGGGPSAPGGTVRNT